MKVCVDGITIRKPVFLLAALVIAMLPPVASVPANAAPRLTVAEGYEISVYAENLGDARLMVLTANGDIIVSQYRDGNVSLVLADKNLDGRSDGTVNLIRRARRPHGLTLHDGRLYVAETHRVTSYRFNGKQLSNRKTVLRGVPGGGGHSSRTLKRGPDGWFYLSVGSSCNVCIEKHPWRAAIIRFKPGNKPEMFAKGLRNSVGFDWHPQTGQMFAVNAGRDHLGDDHPREEMNMVEAGKHYGWPFMHEISLRDPNYYSKRPAGVTFTPPVHMFTAHSTPLSIRFLRHQPDVEPGKTALVARHGSWNRSTYSGYDVVRLDWLPDGTIRETPFITGFETPKNITGRPVDIIEAPSGDIFISDDEYGRIFRVKKK